MPEGDMVLKMDINRERLFETNRITGGFCHGHMLLCHPLGMRKSMHGYNV